MKKFAMLMLVMLVAVILTAGNKACKQQAEEITILIATETLKDKFNLLDSAIDHQCAEGKWTVEECKIWDDDRACVEKTILDILPWAIQKAFENMTPAERERLIRIASGK